MGNNLESKKTTKYHFTFFNSMRAVNIGCDKRQKRVDTSIFFLPNPFTLKIKIEILSTLLYSSYDVSFENLVLDKLTMPLLMFSFILITCLFDIVFIL